MPVVTVNRDKLFLLLGSEYTDAEFDELCFEYGIELDDVTSEKEMRRKELGPQEAADGRLDDLADEVVYKIDIPANRYDMLCVEGVARALNVFKQRIPSPTYSLSDCASPQQLLVKPETALVRPFVVAAVLRGVKFDPDRYASFIDLQDKLHQNLCRQRSLVAIGTHDLDTLSGPFTYEALPPQDINFVPLKHTEPFRADALLRHYSAPDSKLKRYVPIIQDSVVYPVLFDANRTVLSLPPIINGAHSAIQLHTTNVFIECTATDMTKAEIVLNTVCAMFSEYASEPYQVEPVAVTDAFGTTTRYPRLQDREMQVSCRAINSIIGVDLPPERVAELVQRMQLAAELQPDGDLLAVRVPPTRSDVLHPVDVAEDVAIAYGYNNIEWVTAPTVTVGKELPINQLTELLRIEVAMAGYTEVLTWALGSKRDAYTAMRQEDRGDAVAIGNPATLEFEVCRTSLLPAALKTLGAVKDVALPVKLFEISDVVLLEASHETGARNERRLVAVHMGTSSGFEAVHGMLNRLMEVLGVPLEGEAGDHPFEGGYSWRAADHPSFFPGRAAEVLCKGEQVGHFGVIHPDVLQAFDIRHVVAAMELNVQPFCFDQFYDRLPSRTDVSRTS